jgi:hypothetical protein
LERFQSSTGSSPFYGLGDTAFFTHIGFTEGIQVWIRGANTEGKAEALCKELKEAMKRSEELGYHRPARSGEIQRLADVRRRVDPGFQA